MTFSAIAELKAPSRVACSDLLGGTGTSRTREFLWWVGFLGVHNPDLDAIANEQIIMNPSVRLVFHSVDSSNRKCDLVLVRATIRINATHQHRNDGIQVANTGRANFDFVDVNLKSNHTRSAA